MPLREIRELIFAAITKEPVPIYVIAKKVGVSVQTASKYCYILQAEGKIEMKKFGNMQLIRRVGR